SFAGASEPAPALSDAGKIGGGGWPDQRGRGTPHPPFEEDAPTQPLLPLVRVLHSRARGPASTRRGGGEGILGLGADEWRRRAWPGCPRASRGSTRSCTAGCCRS